MPQRLIRDWTDSLIVNNLTPEEEVLFIRLIMKADDYGNYHALPLMVKSLLFPLKENLTSEKVKSWLNKLEDAGLVISYTVNGKHCLHIKNFGQRLRQKRRQFPESPFETTSTTGQQVGSNLPATHPPEEKGSEKEVQLEIEKEPEVENESESEERARQKILKSFLKQFKLYWPAAWAKLRRDEDEIVSRKDEDKNKAKNDPVKLEALRMNYDAQIQNLRQKKVAVVAEEVDKYWDYYQKQDWKTNGGTKITDKEAGFRNWLKRGKQFGK